MLSRVVLSCMAIVLCAAIAVSAAGSEASEFHDCESCVEAGWGWSWSKSACGGFLNTNCDPDSAEALDEEEDEDFNQAAAAQQQQQQQQQVPEPIPFEIPPPAPLPTEPLEWSNTQQTTQLWELANKGDLQSLASWVYLMPTIVHLRSEDGRGILFWASEYEKYEMIDFLLERGADPSATDSFGNTPSDLIPSNSKRPKNLRKTLNKEQAIAQAKQQLQAAQQQQRMN